MIIKLLLMRSICCLYIVLFVVSLVFFILYGHYTRFVIIDDISSGECKIQIHVQRISVLNVNPPMPCFQLIFVPILSSLSFHFTILLHLMRMMI